MSATGFAAAAVLATAALAGAYAAGRHDGRELAAVAAAREERLASQAAESAASAAAVAIARIRVQHSTITQEVQREIQERVVYRDCQHSVEQLQRINATLSGGESEPAGSGSLPAAHTADGFQLRSNNAQAR